MHNQSRYETRCDVVVRNVARTSRVVAGCKLGRVHTTPKEFENGGFTRLKTHQMFSVHTTPEKCNNHRSFWICLESRKI